MSITRGLPEFQAKLKRLDEQTRGKILETACLAGAKLVANKAKENIVANEQVVTGTMLSSIHVGGYFEETAKRSGPEPNEGLYSDIGGKETSGHKSTLLVGTNVPYATYQEFGTSKMTGRPFLRPAAASEEKEVQKAIGEAVKILIQKAVR